MFSAKPNSEKTFYRLAIAALNLFSVQQEIANDDLLRAIKKLKILGNGFSVIPLDSGRYLVQSVPGEFSMDLTAVLQKSESNGGRTDHDMLKAELGWDAERCQKAYDQLVSSGLAWLDEHKGKTSFWIPSIFSSLQVAAAE